MMSLDVLIEEMRITELGIWHSSKNFVNGFSSMDELMTSNGVNSIEVSPLQTEEEILPASLWFQLEPVHIDINFVAHDNKSPNPGDSLQKVEDVERNQESFIVVESFFSLW